MEYTPRFSAETNSAGPPEKKITPSRREGLRVPGLAQIETSEGGPQRAQGFHEAAMQMSERQDDQTTEKKKKRKKKKAAAATPKAEEPKDAQPKPEANRLDAIAAEMTAKTKEKPASETAEQHDAAADFADEKAEITADSEAYEKLPNQELPPHALSGGEVIIDLAALRNEHHSQTPEYELPLRTEEVQPAAAETPLSEELAARQPEPDHKDEQFQPHDSNEADADNEMPVPAANVQPEASEPVPTAASGGEGGGGEPPHIPPESQASVSPEFPEPERNAGYPAVPPEARYAAPTPPENEKPALYASAMSPLSPRIVTAPVEQLVTKRELASAVTRAEQSGASRGLLTGLLVGGAYEHFKHKRREKRQEKKHQKVTKKLEQARAGYEFTTAEQTRKQDITEHQLRTAERRLAESQQTGFGIPPRPEAIARAAAASPETPRPPIAPAAERFSAPRSERTPGQAQREQAAEKPLVIDAEQGIDVPADQRLIREGAFIAQVEKATGKVVENPSFAYGHEYHRERAQEAASHTQQTIATGEAALAAASSDQPGQRQRPNDATTGGGGAMGGGSLPPIIPSAATQGPPPGPQPKTADTSSDDSHTEQPLWPWVVALIVIVICLVVLLH